MAYDGIVTTAVVQELKNIIIGGRIDKIYQPSKDELLFHIHTYNSGYKLLLSSNAVSARVNLTTYSKSNPINAPIFCMVLRKHLSGGRIISINQPSLERIVEISIECIDELGDKTIKKLIIEIMGKHSNIILVNNSGKIIDSLKHIDESISRVREVLPGRSYEYPPSQNKRSPFELTQDVFCNILQSKSTQDITVEQLLANSFTGISRLFSRHICYKCTINPDSKNNEITTEIISRLYKSIIEVRKDIENNNISPCIILDIDKPIDFHILQLSDYSGFSVSYYKTVNCAVDGFYSKKEEHERIVQKKEHLSTIVKQSIVKLEKKVNILDTRIRESSNWETMKLYGELLRGNLYRVSSGIDEISLENYYSDDMSSIIIKLDKNLTPPQNAQKYFRLYNKRKTAYETSTLQLKEIVSEIDYLESVLFELADCSSEIELSEIKGELISQGVMADEKSKTKNVPVSSQPFSFNHNGFEILVGKNNRQNDRITLKLASSKDIWLHTQKIHGSHVIIRTGSANNIPDDTLYYGANLAAYYSKARLSSKVPVDYTMVKYVKKPSGAKPGMVIYENQKTIYVTPSNPNIN